MAASGLGTEAPTIPGTMAGFEIVPGLSFEGINAGKTSEVISVSVLHVALGLVKKFMLKLKLGITRGILGMLGIAGILKLDLSCNESRIAFMRELTCSVWCSNRVSSPRDEALERE